MTPDPATNDRSGARFDAMMASLERGIEPFEVPTLKRYFADPEFREQHDAETQSWRDQTNALIDEGMRRAREKREAGK